MSEQQKDFASIGNVKISVDVIAAIAAIAVSEVDGVTLLPSVSAADFRELLGKSKLGRGVNIKFTETGIIIEMQVLIRYGLVVTELARTVQDNVTNAVESMTALHVDSVNVNVAGIHTETEKK